ncbi:hypothetical protein QJS10_CPA10g01397 [Acorus calamus]|uniref:Reverse transcriptase n=1 Tax=Acorus calamus TaxID=4465 RepID=A0AAV9E1B9_ACOCL|nr:hypothetical protein QJS10_CPA10g01397 [Acorus calamus]
MNRSDGVQNIRGSIRWDPDRVVHVNMAHPCSVHRTVHIVSTPPGHGVQVEMDALRSKRPSGDSEQGGTMVGAISHQSCVIPSLVHHWGLQRHQRPAGGLKGAHKLAFKLRRLKKCLRTWGKQAKLSLNEAKAKLLEVIALRDIEEELGPLDTPSREERSRAKEQLSHILKLEEKEWCQKSKALWLKEGDGNTKYFHKFANQRRRMNNLARITVGEEMLTEDGQIKDRLVRHFQEAF